MTQSGGPENHMTYQDLAQELAGTPEEIYGPETGGSATEANPADFRHPTPPTSAEQLIAELGNQFSAQLNAKLDEFTNRIMPQIGNVVDRRIAAAIDRMAQVGVGPPPNGHANAQGLPPPAAEQPAETPGDKLVGILLELAPALLNKLMGGGAAAAGPIAGFEAQFTTMSNLMNIAKGTFVDTHMESMRTGMKMTADAYTYAYKATGVVPDSAAFNTQVDGPVVDQTGKPVESPLNRRAPKQTIDQMAKSLVQKLVA